MTAMASQITSLTIVYSTVCSGEDQRNIKDLCHWPLWGEFTVDRWIPRTKGQSRGNCSIWWRDHGWWKPMPDNGVSMITQWGREWLICVSKLDHHWFRSWFVAYSAISHYLNQCWFVVNLNFRNKLQLNSNRNSKIFIQENTFIMTSVKRCPFCPGFKVLSALSPTLPPGRSNAKIWEYCYDQVRFSYMCTWWHLGMEWI